MRKFFSSRSGVTAIEYALMAALIAAVTISAAVMVGADLSRAFQNAILAR